MNAFIFWSVHRFFAVRRAAQRASEAGCPEAVDGVIQATAGSCLLSKLRIIRSWRGLGCNMHPSGVWGKAPSSSPPNFCFSMACINQRMILKQPVLDNAYQQRDAPCTQQHDHKGNASHGQAALGETIPIVGEVAGFDAIA